MLFCFFSSLQLTLYPIQDLIALRMDRWNPAQDKLWIRAINKTDQTAFFGK